MGWMEFIEMTKEEFRANLYTALVATNQNPIAIQEQIKIAEAFVFLDISADSERLDIMDQAVNVVCDNTLVGIKTREERQNLLQTVLRDPMRHQLRAYKNQLATYTENKKINPVSVLLEDLFFVLEKNKESPDAEHSGDYVAELTKKQRSDAKTALKLIQQFNFETLPEMIQQIALIAHGEENITGSLSK